MSTFTFAPATKAAAKARVALEGPSGSGKTWTALSIAQGLGQRIAVIDTERGSASKYAGDYAFDTLQMHTYNPRDLVAALSAAAEAGYDVVIVDSLSHFWMGAGGMLEQVDSFAKRSNSGNTFAAWKDARPMEREMIDGLLAYPGHVIVTMRTKTEWVITENDRGRKEPKKIGLKAEQREGLEYEFDIVGDLDLDHNLVISKSRMSALADKVVSRPNSDVGAQILDWLSDGKSLPTVEDYILRVVHATSVDEVREAYREVDGRNMGAAPCMRNGQPTTLRQFIIDRGNEFTGGQPQQPQPTAQDAANAVVRKEQASRMQRHTGPVDDPDFTLPQSVQPPQQSEPPMAHKARVARLNMLIKQKFGITDRNDKLAKVVTYTARTIASTNDLTYSECEHVIGQLEGLPDYVVPQAQQDAAAQSEAVKLAATDPEGDPERVEQDLRDSIESAGSESELEAAWGLVQTALASGAIGDEHKDRLSQAAVRRADTLKADQAWSRPISRAMDEAAA